MTSNRRGRGRLGLAVAIVVALLVAACSSPGGSGGSGGSVNKPAELRIAYQQIPNGALVVKHNRWLEDALGIPIRWTRYDSGASVNQAVANHDVDLGLAGTSSIAVGVPAGLTYKVAWIYDVIGSAEALVVGKDSGIHDLAGLVGKRVAVPFGSTTHYALLAALQRAGIDDNKVDVVDLEPAQIVAAWKARRIDAAYIWQPSLDQLTADNGQVLLTSADLAKQGIITGDLGIVSEELARDFPNVVTTWLQQENRAVELYQNQPAEAGKAIGAELGIPPDVALSQMQGYQFLNAAQQLTPQYLGTPGHTGDLARQLTSTAVFLQNYPQTAKFLKEYKLYLPTPTLADFAKVVDPSFLAGAQGQP